MFKEIYYHQKRCGDSNVALSAVEQVWQSGELIDVGILRQLRDYIKTLEDIPDSFKDWHPTSDK